MFPSSQVTRVSGEQKPLPKLEVSIFSGILTSGVSNWRRAEGTVVYLHWPRYRVVSKWFFYARGFMKVFLKAGWNMFGRNKSNTFEITSPYLKPCEFYIYIPLDDSTLPSAYSVYDNLRVNGRQVTREESPWDVGPQTNVAIVREDKVFLIILRHSTWTV